MKNGEDSRIVGKAICDVKKGCELFQHYGGSVAELMYRCGFATKCRMEGDAVSIALSDILSIAKEKLSLTGGGNHSLNSETHTPQGRHVITQALKQSGAIGESPWDGMDDYLTAELALSHSNNVRNCRTSKDQSHYDDGGVSKLVGVFLVLLADDDAWERASTALGSIDNIGSRHKNKTGEMHGSHCDDNFLEASHINIDIKDKVESESSDDDSSRTDDITASVILSALANLSDNQCEELQQLALAAGRGGHDPWGILLFDLVRLENSNNDGERAAKRKKTQASTTAGDSIHWKVIFEATNSALIGRLSKSLEGETACESFIHSLANQHAKPDGNHGDETPNGEELSVEDKLEAINAVNILRGIEREILVRAVENLDMTSREVLGEATIEQSTTTQRKSKDYY